MTQKTVKAASPSGLPPTTTTTTTSLPRRCDSEPRRKLREDELDEIDALMREVPFAGGWSW